MPTEVGAGANDILSMVIQFAPFLVLIVVFYFLLIRPQRKKDKAVKEMLAALKVGDRVMTIGGIYGTIASIKDNTITIAVGQDKVKLVMDRSSIRGLDDTPSDQQNDIL